MNIVKSAAIVLALAASLAVNAQPTTIKHKGFECTTCHVDGKLTPPDAKTCLACHREESIVKAGERFNFESYFKDPRDGSEIRKEVAINPHDNFHYGRTDQCVNCHREHRPSTVTCVVNSAAGCCFIDSQCVGEGNSCFLP